MECISPPPNPHMSLERRLYASVEPATGSESDFPDGTYAAQQGPPDTCRAAFVVLGHGSFDLGMIGQVVAVLKKIWDLDASTLGLLGSCSTAGVVIGTASAGFLTDRFGRKRILLWGVFIFTFFTLIGSLYENLAWIVTMRFIGGLGAGAVFPLPYLMAFRNRPGQAPRHPRLHLQRHPDGLLSASDALRLVGHQQFFAGRRVARAVHRGRSPSSRFISCTAGSPNPRAADAARTP